MLFFDPHCIIKLAQDLLTLNGMPRKPLEYTNEYPYHIVARTNNKQWFPGSLDQIWEIFLSELRNMSLSKAFSPHSFILMSNHYHLIASCSWENDLSEVMRLFQYRTSVRINRLGKKINHCYGGRYKAGIIKHPVYYANASKYLYRNAVDANLCESVEEWPFVTGALLRPESFITCHDYDKPILKLEKFPLNWLNEGFDVKTYDKIRKASKKTEFKFSRSNFYRVPSD